MKVQQLFEIAMDGTLNKEQQKEFIKRFEKSVGKKTLQKAFYTLYTYLYGEHFTEALAKEAVMGMESANSKGQTFSLEATVEVAKKLGLTFENYNDFDWYFTLNMIASDYAGTLKPEQYADIAKAWIEDVDVPEGKALRYWWKVVKCK